jgi:cytochrome c peroxidase
VKSLERLRRSNLPFIALLLLILILPPILGAWLGLRHAASTEEVAAEVTPGAPAVPTSEPAAARPPQLLAPPDVVVAFNKGGCGNCHVIPGVPGANGQVGPDLSDLGAEAAERRSGISAGEYIRESIEEPNAFIAPDCPSGDCPPDVMLQAFAQTLSPEDLEAIVGYLSVLGTDQAVALTDQAPAPVVLDTTLPPESALEPFAPLPREPADDAQIALGRYLFFDSRLSGNNSLSCATCHQPDVAFTEGEALSRGYPSTRYFRNVPTLLNTVYADRLYWDGRMDGADMPTLVRDHLTEAHFMSMDGRLMVERLNQVPAYVELFEEAYGGGPGFGAVLNAIAAYVGSLNSPPTAYDRYLDGEGAALSEDAQAGLALFEGDAGCSGCHAGPTLSDYAYYNTGVGTDPAIFDDPERHLTFRRFFRVLGVPNYRNLREDVGQFALTSDPDDWGKFRAPSLREVGRTAPYMHDGSVATLEDVVRFYDQGGGPDQTAGLGRLGLSDPEIDQLVAFLESLSSDPVTAEAPALPDYQLVELGP